MTCPACDGRGYRRPEFLDGGSIGTVIGFVLTGGFSEMVRQVDPENRRPCVICDSSGKVPDPEPEAPPEPPPCNHEYVAVEEYRIHGEEVRLLRCRHCNDETRD